MGISNFLIESYGTDCTINPARSLLEEELRIGGFIVGPAKPLSHYISGGKINEHLAGVDKDYRLVPL